MGYVVQLGYYCMSHGYVFTDISTVIGHEKKPEIYFAFCALWNHKDFSVSFNISGGHNNLSFVLNWHWMLARCHYMVAEWTCLRPCRKSVMWGDGILVSWDTELIDKATSLYKTLFYNMITTISWWWKQESACCTQNLYQQRLPLSLSPLLKCTSHCLTLLTSNVCFP